MPWTVISTCRYILLHIAMITQVEAPLAAERSRGAHRRGLIATGLAAIGLPFAARPSSADEPVMIYAAATLRSALDAVIEGVRASLNVPITPVYGPTPMLVQQLQNGAPGDIFFSADADWMNEAVSRGIVDSTTRVDLLSSTLVLIAPAARGESIVIQPGFPLAALLGQGRLAMCDPMMMPAGRYGRTALQELGVWENVKQRVANAADVQTALAYVSRHEAPLGIVFDTDARLDPGVRVMGTFPPESHPPIVYPVATVARSSNPNRDQVFRYIKSAPAVQVFMSFGYTAIAR